MPPHVPRKRRQEPAVDEGDKTKHHPAASEPISEPRKVTLYDALDATATPVSMNMPGSIAPGLQSSGSESPLTSFSDSDFEDLPAAKRQKTDATSDDEDDEIEFEDVATPTIVSTAAPAVSGDLELTLNTDSRISLVRPFGDKRGPSKRERKVRTATHCLHVLFLLWHNAVRNSWLCDLEVQAIMISHLPPQLWDEVDRWRQRSGLSESPASNTSAAKRRDAPKSRGKRDDKETGRSSRRTGRGWGPDAKRLEKGVVDMSHGDPLLRLMQSLVSWWKHRFRVTTPGLRKWGYMALDRLDRLVKDHKTDFRDAPRFGEHISDRNELRECASSCRGSRDIGAQLFTALLRGLGFEARMVANLPCLGFGWSKQEDAEPEREDVQGHLLNTAHSHGTHSSDEALVKAGAERATASTPRKTRRPSRSKQPSKQAGDELRMEYEDTDDESVVEVKITPRTGRQAWKKSDQDLEYPHYWTEILSPVTGKYLPVDSTTKGIVASNRDLIESLEPRGSKADKAKQIMAYIVAYSPDGTAKDVTVRYLRKQMLPGRTKGVRMPQEKIAIHNRRGKVTRYEEFDWFKTVMSGFRRGGRDRPLTEIDDDEETTDLRAAKPEKKVMKEGAETVQYYKQSKEYVLERHLKREEGLKANAAPVKKVKIKGKGGKAEEEDVYLRSDVVGVKSAETWHKQGRAPRPGEIALKRVPYRAATLNRRREILQAEAETGEKVLQGLYSLDQTEWIIPPPIENGVIPKNEYGNIDLFVEHMCPEGAVHVPYRGAMQVCKRLQIDYAEAVVDFEFGHRMAVPVIQGVVVAEEYRDQVMAELEKYEAERARKEDEKRRKAALGLWRKFLMGLRIVERIRQDYGEIDDRAPVRGGRQLATAATWGAPQDGDEEMAGGFVRGGYHGDGEGGYEEEREREEEEEEEEGEDEEGDGMGAYGARGHRQRTSFFPACGEDGDEAEGDGSLVLS